MWEQENELPAPQLEKERAYAFAMFSVSNLANDTSEALERFHALLAAAPGFTQQDRDFFLHTYLLQVVETTQNPTLAVQAAALAAAIPVDSVREGERLKQIGMRLYPSKTFLSMFPEYPLAILQTIANTPPGTHAVKAGRLLANDTDPALS